MAKIEDIMSKSDEHYRFHGVRAATLGRLLAQADGGDIRLWGTDHDEHVDNQEYEFVPEYVQGAGYLYTVGIRDIDMSYNEFVDDGGMVLVLEKQSADPFECEHPTDRRQCIIKCEEWRVVGGLRPIYDEDGDLAGEEAFSLEDVCDL